MVSTLTHNGIFLLIKNRNSKSCPNKQDKLLNNNFMTRNVNWKESNFLYLKLHPVSEKQFFFSANGSQKYIFFLGYFRFETYISK